MAKSKILIVDDEEWIRNQLKWSFSNDYDLLTASDIKSVKKVIAQEKPDLVLLDISLTPDIGTGTEGITLIQHILGIDKTVKIIMITGNDTRENAHKCVTLGAYDFYSKPIDIEEIKVSVKRALYIQSLERENERLQSDSKKAHEFRDIICNCKQMTDILDMVRRVATSDVTILIQGESGTGKELIAKAIHYNSNRKDKPFITINCGAIPENLLESELFGHEKGAFTSAHMQRKGKLEIAQNGSIFLDEIAELSTQLQVKMLRFLQEKEIERVGGREPISLDIRIIAATNKNLIEEVKKGTFREDLYYRLNVISIFIPPLRNRNDDMIILANHFIKKFNNNVRSNIIGFTDDAISAIRSHNWPGNVRELENKIQRAMIMAKSNYIIPEDLELSKPSIAKNNREQLKNLSIKEARDCLELNYIKESLTRNNNNITHIANELGITRSTLYDLMNKYGLIH